MSSSLALIPSSGDSQLDRSAEIRALQEMVLNSVASEHSKRNYAKALDEVFTLCANRSQGLSRALLMEYLERIDPRDIVHTAPRGCVDACCQPYLFLVAGRYCPIDRVAASAQGMGRHLGKLRSVWDYRW
jgi:hypothetical protein